MGIFRKPKRSIPSKGTNCKRDASNGAHLAEFNFRHCWAKTDCTANQNDKFIDVMAQKQLSAGQQGNAFLKLAREELSKQMMANNLAKATIESS